MMNRRIEIQKLMEANNRLVSENKRLAAEVPAKVPEKKILINTLGVNGIVTEYVFDKNTLKYMGRYEQTPNQKVDLYLTPKGNMVLHKYNNVTNQWTYFIPTDEEKEIYANAIIDLNKLTEL